MQAGEEQRETETQNLKQAPGSELSAQSPMRGLNPQTARSWPVAFDLKREMCESFLSLKRLEAIVQLLIGLISVLLFLRE